MDYDWNEMALSMRRGILLLALMSCGLTTVVYTQSDAVESTDRFAFHNNFWINLHHYLYQKADGGQLKHLEEDSSAFLDIGEPDVMRGTAVHDHAVLDMSVAFYRQQMTDKAESSEIRLWLQSLDEDAVIIDTSISSQFTDVLNRFAPVYRSTLWPVHKAHNALILKTHIKTIEQFEATVVKRMVEFSGLSWPKNAPVRVDLTAYANYAGAYTAIRPSINVTISTLDPGALNSTFVETVFHEGSHLLFSRDSPYRSRIYYMSQEMGMDFPRGLWHAAQFYLCGRVVQDLLKPMGVSHQLTLYARDIFPEFDSEKCRNALESYYQGADMETAIKALLEALE